MANKMADRKKNAASNEMAEPEPKSSSEKSKAQSSEKSKTQAKEVKSVSRESKPAPRRENKPSLITRVTSKGAGRFIRDAYYELRYKVTWPTFEEARTMTIAVIILSVAVGILLGAADAGLLAVFRLITGSGR